MPSDSKSSYRAGWLTSQSASASSISPETLRTNLLICRLIETHDSCFNDVNERVQWQKGTGVHEKVFLLKAN